MQRDRRAMNQRITSRLRKCHVISEGFKKRIIVTVVVNGINTINNDNNNDNEFKKKKKMSVEDEVEDKE